MTEQDKLIQEQRREIKRLKDEIASLKELQQRLFSHVPAEVLGDIVADMLRR